VIYSQHILNGEFETELLTIAPSVYFMHGYFGTCVSGTKSFKFPVVKPCDRRFGWRCLLHYYPHRCGGLNPITMFSEYERQSKRLQRLKGYQIILANSDHMLAEIVNHGLVAERIYPPIPEEELPASSRHSTDLRVLFMGRMDFLKGGKTFIDALPQVCAKLNRPMHVTFAGEGPDRAVWEREAANAQSQTPNLKIEFVGWMEDAEHDRLFADCDLLVVPSLWPEPFGLVGPEAGLRGVPAAAFAVGGIPEWLIDGVNGFLAPAEPPTSAGLAEAIVKCLRDESVHQRLKLGAREIAQRFTTDRHLTALLEIFERVAAVASTAGAN
jgi:glycosyltransferase involved in cell wall biosynthesis